MPRQAHPKHRLHQKAAQAVLKALLPETGTDIKGHMRSRRRNCWKPRAMPSRPRDFDDLLRILDSELRLITPTDPEGSRATVSIDGTAGRAILPAHPRLPRPLAAGLADPQAEGDPARPGRTAAGGTVGALERQAREPPPAVALEWANIRLLTRKKDWTEPQRRMMKRAGRVHGLRGVWPWLS